MSVLPTQSSLASQRIYFVMPDRYANGVPANDAGGLSGGRATTGFDPTDTGYFHGGDLKGLAEHLQRIKDLGFTALWLTPVLKQQAVPGQRRATTGTGASTSPPSIPTSGPTRTSATSSPRRTGSG